MGELLEAGMVISFGISWPLSIQKSWTSRTTKGKSVVFSYFIFLGYALGVLSKIVAQHVAGKPLTYVFAFYVLNFIMVGIDIVLYYRNKRLDALREASKAV